MAEYCLVFTQLLFDIRFDVPFEVDDLEPLTIIFLLLLLLDLGYRGLLFASTTNLEEVPRFADICLL